MMMSSEVVVENRIQGCNYIDPGGQQVLPSDRIESEQPSSLNAVVTSQDADEGGKTLGKNVCNNSLLSTVTNVNTNSKPHQTAEELKQIEDSTKAGEADGPMSPFFW